MVLTLLDGKLPVLNADVEGASLRGVPSDGMFEDGCPLAFVGKSSSTAIESTRGVCAKSDFGPETGLPIALRRDGSVWLGSYGQTL